MEKPTTLSGDLPSINKLGRILTKAKKKKYAMIRKKRGYQAPYIKDAEGKVHGTKELARSAIYPKAFCTAIFKLWKNDVAQLR